MPTARMEISKSLVMDVIDAFEVIGCQFWACKGPTLRPTPMITCRRCSELARLRRLVGRPAKDAA